MTPNIELEKREKLDKNINELLNTLRELESDYDELDNTTNDHVGYIIDNILQRIYSYNDDAMASAIGLLELTKIRFVNKYVLPVIKQSEFDSHN